MNIKLLEQAYLEVMEAQALRIGNFKTFLLHEQIEYGSFYLNKLNNKTFREHIGIDMTCPARVIIYWWK